MVLNLGFSMFIQYLWGLLNDMSFLTIMTMISITVPGIAKLIQGALLNFIYLDILQTESWLFPLIFPEVPEDDDGSGGDDPTKKVRRKDIQETPINEFYDENGFSTKSLIKNLGSTFVYMVLLVLTLALLPLLKMLESSEEPPSRLTRFSRWMHKNMIWGFPLRFVLQQYAPIVIACGINLYGLKFDEANGKLFSSVMSILFTSTSFVALYVMVKIIKSHREAGTLESDYFQQRFGCLTDGLRISSFLGCYWNLFILCRWQLTNLILLLLKDHNEVQILTLWLLSVITQALMLRCQPIYDKNENLIAVFIEVMVSFYLYVLLTLTDYWGENPFREQGGTGLVSVVGLSVFVNFAKLAYNFTRETKEYLRKKRIALMRLMREQEQESIYQVLKNPQLYDPAYIPTIEEEQALASQLMLLKQSRIVHKGLLELINNLSRYKSEVEGMGAYGRVISNWRGQSPAQLMISQLAKQAEQQQTLGGGVGRGGLQFTIQTAQYQDQYRSQKPAQMLQLSEGYFSNSQQGFIENLGGNGSRFLGPNRDANQVELKTKKPKSSRKTKAAKNNNLPKTRPGHAEFSKPQVPFEKDPFAYNFEDDQLGGPQRIFMPEDTSHLDNLQSNVINFIQKEQLMRDGNKIMGPSQRNAPGMAKKSRLEMMGPARFT